MKLFVKNIFIFISIYLGFSFFISIFIPYYWGNKWFSIKVNYLKEKDNYFNYNTYFFGSSRFYRQIDPIIFDRTINERNRIQINSFNLGAPATFNPQIYYLYDNFIDSMIADNTKYCFIELMDVKPAAGNQELNTYWRNSTEMKFLYNSIINNSKLNFNGKALSIMEIGKSFTFKIFHLGGYFGNQFLNTKHFDKRFLGILKNGFFPIEYDYKTTTDVFYKENVLYRRNSILKDTLQLYNRKMKILKSYNSIDDKFDIINLKRIKQLIKESKERGIHLIFVLSPRNASQKLLNLSKHIPKHNFIDMANPQKYPTLYFFRNSFDIGHLNVEGAKIYSRLLAIEFDSILKTNKTVNP